MIIASRVIIGTDWYANTTSLSWASYIYRSVAFLRLAALTGIEKLLNDNAKLISGKRLRRLSNDQSIGNSLPFVGTHPAFATALLTCLITASLPIA